MHEIDIYGDIVAFKYWGDNEFDLKDLKNKLSELTINEGETLTINIHTYGGDTTTAFGMYNLLKRFKTENKITLRTRVDGHCASSGVIILLAGDKRVGNSYIKPFVHNAWTWTWDGINKEDAKKIYEDLSAVDDAIASLYATETTITKEEALQLMSESRELTAEECQKYGFYTELENVVIVETSDPFNAVITRNIQNRKNNLNDMNKNKKSVLNTLLKQVQNFLKSENKIVFTATNEELDFYELGDEDTPKVGDKAKFDGKPAGDSNDGTYILASGETYKFEGEELKEIIEANDDENDDLEVENQKLKDENAELKSQLEALNKKKQKSDKELAEAKNIIKGFQNLQDDEEDDNGEETRTPKINNKGKTKLSSLYKNIK